MKKFTFFIVIFFLAFSIIACGEGDSNSEAQTELIANFEDVTQCPSIGNQKYYPTPKDGTKNFKSHGVIFHTNVTNSYFGNIPNWYGSFICAAYTKEESNTGTGTEFLSKYFGSYPGGGHCSSEKYACCNSVNQDDNGVTSLEVSATFEDGKAHDGKEVWVTMTKREGIRLMDINNGSNLPDDQKFVVIVRGYKDENSGSADFKAEAVLGDNPGNGSNDDITMEKNG